METTKIIIQIVFVVALILLVYTYIIYPFVAAVIGTIIRPIKRLRTPTEKLPTVSLLVPAHNEATVIEAKISNFLELDYPSDRIELIVADDGSTDGTAEKVKSLTNDRVKLLELPGRNGKAAAMNQLVECSQHSILFFNDANVILSTDAILHMVDHLQHRGVGAVTGEVRLIGSGSDFVAGESLYYLLERRIQSAESRLGSVMGVDGGLYLLRSELYEPLPDDTILDDFQVSMNVMRAGYRVIYESDAKAIESGTTTAREEFSRRSRISAGAVQLLKRGWVPRLTTPLLWWQFISHKVLRWMSPVLLIVLLLSNVFLVNESNFFLGFLGGQIGAYFILAVVTIIPWLRATSLGSVLYYFGLSQFAIFVGLVRGIFNLQSSTWRKEVRSSFDQPKLQKSTKANP